MIYFVNFAVGEIEGVGRECKRSPWFEEYNWSGWYFSASHFDDVFQVVFADAYYFREGFDCVGLIHRFNKDTNQ